MSFHPAAVATLDAADFCLEVSVDSRTGKTVNIHRLTVYDRRTRKAMTEAALNMRAFEGGSIMIRGCAERLPIPHIAEKGWFSVSDIIQAVVDTERSTRDYAEWMGRVDTHHIYFEGLKPSTRNDHTYTTVWGS